MPSTANSELFLAAVWAVALSTILLALTVLIIVVTLRLHYAWRARTRRRIHQRWRPIIHQSLIRVPNDLPPLPKKHLQPFLELWNHLHDLTHGPATEGLNRLARKLRIDYAILPLLHHRRFRRRLLAIVTCGHLREYAAWDTLNELLEHPNPVLSLAAARALVEIDPRQAIGTVIQEILKREDWPAGKVATLLTEAPGRLVAPPLLAAIHRDPHRHAPRLLRYLGLVDQPEAQQALAEIIRSNEDDHLIALALQELREPEYRPLIYPLAHHPNWYIRVQVANALRRLGDAGDIPLLASLLGDRQWWVRYRAAQALVHLARPEQLERLQQHLRDPYARDILRQAIAEQTLEAAA